ncbi:MAG: hypothetical protein NC340_08920 [Ruminococcus flavefaciens]|nr:hypothetical protein [Ruminococcus flavefaciens]MCM1232660.1 hypothetical protein [Ruminococcus flavefaciens]
MELKEIKEKLDTLGIPVAYLQFTKPQKLPFVVYFEAGGEVTGADNLNLYRRKDIVIELYTAKKDVRLERKLERLFPDTELEKSVDTWLKDEKMFMVAYTFETIQYIYDDDE